MDANPVLNEYCCIGIDIPLAFYFHLAAMYLLLPSLRLIFVQI
jgi:hypothetical protein